MTCGAAPVPVLGVALRSALGDTPGDLFDALCAGRSAVRPIAAWTAAGLRSTHAAPIGGDLCAQDPAAGWLRDVVERALDVSGMGRAAARTRRTALVVGTSAGAMRSAERMLRGEPGSTLGAGTYFAPTVEVARGLGLSGPVLTVSSACASSTIAIGLARDLLCAGRCDLAIAAGYDALSLFVQAGFDALGALANGPPRPFRADRTGLVLGEGAAAMVLGPSGEPAGHGPGLGGPSLGSIVGFGASGDARHVTAPDRDGMGLSRAIDAALADAGIDGGAIDFVSAHGTATPYNDAMEALALRRALGERASAVPVHATKAALGHTLGAAGILEAAVALEALRRGVVPPTIAPGEPDPSLGLFLPAAPTPPRSMRLALKVSSAFGGSNAALVLRGANPEAAK